jgi:aminomethyltransferase
VSDNLKHTAFEPAQRDLGAAFTDWEGWCWADHFGDATAEHLATRNASNLWDESPLRKWTITGPDTMRLSDLLYTNDMSTLEVGQVRYGALCNADGKMVMDGTIFKQADDRAFSVTSYDSDLAWYRRVAAENDLEVEVEDATEAMPHLQVQGPKSREILAGITEGVDLASLRYFRFVEGVTVGGCNVTLSRTGYSGELGYEVFCRPEDALKLWDAVLAAGRPHGMKPIGLSGIETVRIECGLLFPDVDFIANETDPFEVRLGGVVKLDKPGDFVGKDALRRLVAAGGPQRLLVTLQIDGDEVPEYGAAVTRNGVEVGVVRSPCRTPTFDMAVIGIGPVDRAVAEVGTEVEVALGGGTVRATVTGVPLYDPSKGRPRS